MKVIIETERLYLREFILDDAIHLFQMNSDPEALKYTGDLPFATKGDALKFIKSYTAYVKTGYGRYAVIRQEDGQFLGWCGLKYHPNERVIDLGFRFYKAYWGQGYATESAMGCIDFAFAKAKYPFLVAHTHLENIRSQKVLLRCGMQLQNQITYDGKPAYLYKLDNPDYQLREIAAEDTWPVRHPVLRAGRPLEDVYMEADEKETTFHLGMYYKGQLVGIASFMEDYHQAFSGVQSRLRGMAVLPEYRKRGLAELLLKRGEELLRAKGTTLLWFNARIGALNFYKNLDYEVVGDEFDIPLVGPHYRMKKDL